MPLPTIDSGLRDNHSRGTVADFLKAKIRDGSTLSVVSAYFTIYAYDALKDSLHSIDHLDFSGDLIHLAKNGEFDVISHYQTGRQGMNPELDALTPGEITIVEGIAQ